MTFQELLREARTEHGLTQEAAARELGVSFVTWNSWENGRSEPNPATARRIAALLGLKAVRLLVLLGKTEGRRGSVPAIDDDMGNAIDDALGD